MTQTTTIDGTSRTSVVKRNKCEWAESAYLGEVGTGSLMIHDDVGDIAVVGHKTIDTEQSACSSWPPLFVGFVGRKTFGRGETYTSGAGREITVSTKDGNDLLNRKVARFSGGDSLAKRPAETVGERVTWVLASAYLTGLVNDFGAVTYPADLGMDATDYRGQRPGDVLAACAKKASFNYYVRWNYTHSDWELVFRDDNASTDDTSSITITNDGTANGTSSFAPFQDAELTEDPEDVYSGAYGSYATGAVYETRAATATAFVERDGQTDDSGIKTAAAARLEAQSFLWQSHTEEHSLTLTIRMRAAYVNLIRAGQRVSVTMTHLATQGYDSATYFRVLRRRVRQPLDTDNDYDVTLDLSPQEAGPPATDVVQRAFGRGSTNGTLATFANPLTIGNKLLVFVTDSANALPAAPSTTGPLSFWGAGAWTRLNGSSRTAIDSHFNSAPPTAEVYNGLAAYYKTIDATTQTGYVPGTYVTVGAFELTSTANLAGATVVTQDVGTTTADPCVFDAGSLGTVASGELAFFCAIFENNVNAGGAPTGYTGDFIPMTVVAPGDFTERWYHGIYDSNYGPYPASYPQQTWIGDLDGSGASVEASIEKARNERFSFDFGTVGWAAIGLKVSV